MAAPEPREAPPPPKQAALKEDAGAIEALVNDAQDDYVHGKYESAITKARKANASAGGSNGKAWRIIGASSCFLKDKNGAVAAWNKLSTMDRQFLKYVCQRNTITIP